MAELDHNLPLKQMVMEQTGIDDFLYFIWKNLKRGEFEIEYPRLKL